MKVRIETFVQNIKTRFNKKLITAYRIFLISAEDTRFGTDVKDDFNSTDFGLSYGIGVKIPASNKKKLSLEYK